MPLVASLVHGVTEIIKKLLPVITEQIILAWGLKGSLIKLKGTLESIQALITSVDEKQVNNPTLGLWLSRLKDVVYDIDDVMDEFSYETLRPVEHKVQALVSCSNPLLFQFRMAWKIQDINKNLDEIFKNGERYGSQNTNTSQDNHTRELEHIKKRNRLTSSDGGDSVPQGRDGAKSDIIKMLIDKSSPSSSSGISSQPQKVSTLSIVGMGGLGKTTLAQMVYNEDSILRTFEPRAWVCVSDTFDIYNILRNIIESITGEKYKLPSNVDVLQKKVKEKLSGKKYLLVLDDLWNEDAQDWDKLKSFLVCGALGSKILVTTRNQKVAYAAGGRVHNLNRLSDDVCWSIIKKKVLSQDGAELTTNMTNIGTEIARKCDGLPLAAISLGSLMCSRRDESYWLSIVNNINNVRGTPEYTGIISILKLSFDNLPSPLKQCFSYCCIFPKDWEINREMLIRLWMAEGFLLPSSGGENTSLEDIGNEYFEYLVWSSFFQDVKRDGEWGDVWTCKMHDLVHDLATTVLDCNEFGIARVTDGKEEASEVRRLQLLFDEGPHMASPKVLNVTKLRTVIALDPKGFLHINSFFRYKRLRILCPLNYWDTCSLSGDLEFRLAVRKLCFASSISKLKHLRYLDLSKCCLSGEVSINHSYNLQTLVLSGCKNIPSGLLSRIGSLKSLRHLDISNSDITVIPEDIGSLEHLSCLDLSWTRIPKLPDSVTLISSLRKLKFDNCRNLDGLPRDLGLLTRLRCLDLSGTEIKVLPESCISNLCNLEIVKLGVKCELPKEIKNWPKLRIFTHYRDDDVMPRGIEKLTCLETLRDYKVRKENEICGSPDDNKCSSGVEDFAGLNSLQKLFIRNLENVRGGKQGGERAKLKDKQHLRKLDLYWGSIGDDDNSTSVNDTAVLEGLEPHSNLKDLRISGFSGVKLPKWMGSPNCLPNLVELELFNLNNCEKLPALGMLPFLRVLRIERMKSIRCLGEEFYYQQENEDEEESSSSRKRSTLFPSLVRLNIRLENLEEWVAPTPLSSSSSSSSSSSFPSLDILSIIHCPRLRTIPPITLFSFLKELTLYGTNDHVVSSFLNRGGGEEGCTTPLTSISIKHSPDVIYLPPLGVLLQHNTPNLQQLKISNCYNFQGFRDDDDNLNNNNNTGSLQSLMLTDCPKLTSLPDLRLYTSLRKLTIYGCEKLNKESIPYDLKKSLTFLEQLKVDFIQRDEGGPDVYSLYELINLMEE